MDISPGRDNIYSAIQDKRSVQWWVDHLVMPQAAIDIADWDICAEVMRSLPDRDRRRITKHASENCGVGSTLLHWKKQDDPDCPRCQLPEDTAHILLCQAEGTHKIWDDYMMQLESHLYSKQTRKDLQDALLLQFQQWRSQEPSSDHADPDINEALQQQSLLGWKSMFEALPAKKWAQIQHNHYKSIDSHLTGKSWIKSLLKLLLKLSKDMWKHRCDVKHWSLKPRHAAEAWRLDLEIADEFLLGPADLPVGARKRFETSLIDVLGKPLSYKQRWLLNAHAARQSQAQKRTGDSALLIASQQCSKLLQWIETNIPS